MTESVDKLFLDIKDKLNSLHKLHGLNQTDYNQLSADLDGFHVKYTESRNVNPYNVDVNEPSPDYNSVVNTSNQVPNTVKALYDFSKEQDGDLQFKKDDVIQIIECTSSDWWKGFVENDKSNIGIFPSSYVTVLNYKPKISSRPNKQIQPVQTQTQIQAPNNQQYMQPSPNNQPYMQQPPNQPYIQQAYYPPSNGQPYYPPPPSQPVVVQQEPQKQSGTKKFFGRMGQNAASGAASGAGFGIGMGLVNNLF